jgi:3-oxoacyl-[acyl-carrier protein] reductase
VVGSLQDRVAIVTGGAKGIGRATVERFAAEGARVIAADSDEDALASAVAAVTKSGAQCIGVAGDTTEMSTAREIAEVALRGFGRIDILVNNVGGGSPGRIWEMTEEHWDRVMRLNTRSMFVCTRAVVNQMMEQRYGRIVNISSGSRDGSRWLAAYFGAAPYSTGKAGVYGFTRDVSLELAEYGITVNSVSPGPIATERFLSHEFVHDDSLPLGPLRLTPLRRFGEPHEIAAAIAFIASDEASYITGEILDVNGGGGR